jgi:ubiquinol-cytochrome c reductase cytochrome c subunit
MALAALGFALLCIACGYGDRPKPYRPPGIKDPVARGGHEIYQRDCAYCHGADGEGTDEGPDLVAQRNGPALTDFMLSTGRMPIDDPRDPITRREARYTDEEIDAIVEHVASFGGEGPDVPRVHPERGDTSLGMLLYQDNCAACHSTSGIGGTLTEGRQADVTGDVARRGASVVPSVLSSSPTEIAEAMRTGPGAMPVFAEETFDDDDVDAIVAYVSGLQRGEVDRGGAAIGRIGPVAEGAVALFAGLLALIVFTRWIGEKSR